MKTRKIPMRTCVVTKESRPKKELMRVVRTPEGDVKVDSSGKQNGRGAYLILSKQVIEQAKKSKALDKKLEVVVPSSIYDELLSLIHE